MDGMGECGVHKHIPARLRAPLVVLRTPTPCAARGIYNDLHKKRALTQYANFSEEYYVIQLLLPC